MKRRLTLLVIASIWQNVAWAFSVHDDVFAFPQYEVVFSDKYVSEEEANAKLSLDIRSSIESNDKKSPAALHIAEDGGSGISTRKPSHSDSGEDSLDEGASQSYERMILKNQTYLCTIPQPRSSRNETKHETSPEEEEKELQRATDRGWELLQGMAGTCIYYQSGWWSYSFCYHTEVKQFHPLAPQRGGQPSYPPIEDARVPSFTLGQFQKSSPEAKKLEGTDNAAIKNSKDRSTPESRNSKNPNGSTDLAIRKKGDTRYLVQHLDGGSTCDLTGKPRKVEVQFHCHPQSADRIGWIKEIATCTYLMVIYTPRLCNDVAFLPPKEHKAAPIICSEVLAESEMAAWHARQASRMEDFLLGGRLRDGTSDASAPVRPVVGGIEVGGMKQVGSEGQRISPPQVVEQVSKQGEIVAQWHPSRAGGAIEMLTDEDLRDLKLDPKLVERTKDEIHQEADGRPWRMEYIDLGNGVHELVGVVETDEEEEILTHGRDEADEQTDQRQQEDKEERKQPRDQPRNPQGRAQRKHGRKDEKGQRGSKEQFKEDL